MQYFVKEMPYLAQSDMQIERNRIKQNVELE